MITSFYTKKELDLLGLKSYGENVSISNKTSIYDAGNIIIGDNVRIDDFCILSGKITIGSFVHISAYCALYGQKGIEIGNFSGLSSRCTVFSATDDFSGEYMIGPLIADNYRNIIGGLVKISNYVQVGSNSIIMPSVCIAEGAAIGAFSFVKKDVKKWKIYFGIPAKLVKNRSKKLLNYVGKI